MKILVQGAFDRELRVLFEKTPLGLKSEIHGYMFYMTEFAGQKLIISKTEVGMINTAIATTIALERFNPDLVISQGSCGGHTHHIHRGDMLICDKAVNMNDWHTKLRAPGEGSNPLEWNCSTKAYAIKTDPKLVRRASSIYYEGNKAIGTIGSGDMFSREADRIAYLRAMFDEKGEDMETFAAYNVCARYKKPCIGFCVVVNNELIGEYVDGSSVEEEKLQRYVLRFISSFK